MNQEIRTKVLELLSLPDDAYFAIEPSAVTALNQQLAKLVQPPPLSRPPGAVAEVLPELRVIATPTRVDLKQRTSFPVLIAEVRGNLREWAVHSRQNRHVILSNLSTGDVFAGGARDRGRRMPQLPASATGTPVDAFNAKLSTLGVVHRDVLTWVPPDLMRGRMHGRLALTLIDYDLPSNTRRVQTLGEADPANPRGSGAKARSVVKLEAGATPAIAAGVAFTAPAATPSRLRAEFKLERTQVTLLNGPAEARQAMFVASSLVLVQLDSESPLVLDFAVGAEGKASDAVQSVFAIDLARLAPAGKYQVYLVIGETVSGPVSVTLTGS